MRKTNVLIVDDSICLHKLVRASLKPQRVIIHAAYDGEEALRQAVELKPDLILMDIDLPKIDGLEVGRRLKASPKTHQIPIIFLTADFSLRDKVQAFEMGAVDFITKPFKPDELCAKVRAAARIEKPGDEPAPYAMVDRLTGLFNRRYFETRLDGELARARRSGQPLGCVLADVDQMGTIEVMLGRKAAEALLLEVGRAILQACRREDVVCRFGADEFAVLAVEAKGEGLQILAERIRTAIQSVQARDANQSVAITASIGAALSRFSTGMSLVVEAAEALEAAQKAGGNEIVIGRELVELRLTA